jgi:hypothetical protein
MLDRVKALTAMRKQHAVLRHGSLDAPLLLDQNVIVLSRADRGAQALVAMNNGLAARTVTVALPPGFKAGDWTDALDGARFDADGRSLTLSIPALSGRVLLATQ